MLNILIVVLKLMALERLDLELLALIALELVALVVVSENTQAHESIRQSESIKYVWTPTYYDPNLANF